MAFVEKLRIPRHYDGKRFVPEPLRWYCGIEGVSFHWRGEWADPVLGYDGYAINEPTAVDGLREEFLEETGNDDFDKFPEWLRDNSQRLIDALEDLLAYYREIGEIA